jgi:hypothetical protein
MAFIAEDNMGNGGNQHEAVVVKCQKGAVRACVLPRGKTGRRCDVSPASALEEVVAINK